MKNLARLLAPAMVIVSSSFAYSAEWVPIKNKDGVQVREVDKSSIVKKDSEILVTSRHSFEGRNQYLIGRIPVHQMHIKARVNCREGTYAVVETEAYDEKEKLITRQTLTATKAEKPTPQSIDEQVLHFVCGQSAQP